MLEKILKYAVIKWLKKHHLNCPPWLEKFLKYAGLKWLKHHLNCPPWLEKILKYAGLKWRKRPFNGDFQWVSSEISENAFIVCILHTNPHINSVKSI